MTRTELIQKIIDKYKLTSYLEIGVRDGENFNKIRCDVKDSVDPEYPATHQMTSDEFFFKGTIAMYHIIFIDGLHIEAQVYQDLQNALTKLVPNGFIIVHDCNPKTKWHTRPPEEYTKGEWNGTVYRAFIRFKRENPDLSCFVVDTDYGCGVITDRNILKNDIFADDWEYFDTHRKELLQLITVEKFNNLI